MKVEQEPRQRWEQQQKEALRTKPETNHSSPRQRQNRRLSQTKATKHSLLFFATRLFPQTATLSMPAYTTRHLLLRSFESSKLNCNEMNVKRCSFSVCTVLVVWNLIKRPFWEFRRYWSSCGLFVLIAGGGNGVASPEIGGFRRGKSRGGRWKLRRDEEREWQCYIGDLACWGDSVVYRTQKVGGGLGFNHEDQGLWCDDHKFLTVKIWWRVDFRMHFLIFAR